MVILLLVGVCAVVGCLLYLPFFIWFRFRKPSKGRFAVDVTFTRKGYVLLFVQLIVIFAGLGAGEFAPESTLGALIRSNAGVLKWWTLTTVVFWIIGKALQGTGVVLERPADATNPTAEVASKAPAPAHRGLHFATPQGIPVFIHWTYLFGGLFIAFIAGAGIVAGLGYCVAYAALILIHELGHVAAARCFGLRVYSVELSGIGGLCRVHAPRGVRDTFVVFSAGLAAQVLVLLLTLASVRVLGAPESRFGQGIVTTFTWVNALVFLINLVPGRTSSGVLTDGSILWGVWRHVFKGHPHPLVQQHAASPLIPPETSLLTIEGMAPAGFTTGIELLNDDTTTMEFVVEMLVTHLKIEREAAIALMLDVHTKGGLLLPLPDLAQAEAIADAITRGARAQGHALICRAVDASRSARLNAS